MNDSKMQTAPESKRNTPAIEVLDIESFDYDGYQVVRGEFFSHVYEPSLTLNRNKVSVNMACIRRLPNVDYVQILVNPEEKKLAVRPCKEEEKDSFRWCSDNENRNPKQVTCRIFFAKVTSLMEWDVEHRYKLLGKLIRSNGEFLFTFDLNTPEIFERKIKDGENVKTSRTPTYPEDWKNQFGLSVKEHQSNLQVNLFDGYAVFGIKEKKPTAADNTNIITKEESTNESAL